MKAARIFRFLFLSGLIFFGAAGTVSSLSLSLYGGVDTGTFNPEDTTFLATRPFVPFMQPQGEARLDGTFLSFVDFSVVYQMDPVLRNVLGSDIITNLGPLRLGLGAFFGFLNADPLDTTAGFSLTVGMSFPGYFFAEGRLYSSVTSQSDVTGDTREGLYASAGLWVPNVQILGFLDNKSYIDRTQPTLFVTTAQSKVGGSIRFFAKNIHYNISLDVGMKTLSRSYEDPATRTKTEDEVSSIFAGPNLQFEFSRFIRWSLKAEINVGLTGIAQNVISVNGMTGFTFTLINQ
jgi:hypothetical protein